MPPTNTFLNKLKVQLKLSITRLRMVQQKETALAKQQRRVMAQLLETGKIESARIRVENIIRSDLHTELLEIVELYCELLAARAGLLAADSKDCDPGLAEAVKSLVYAAPRVDGVKELTLVRGLLADKFGKDFVLDAMDGHGVSSRVVDRLKVEPPEPRLVQDYLEAIAEAYGVDWPKGARAKREAESAAAAAGGVEGDGADDDDDQPSDGAKVRALEAELENGELSRATPPRDLGPRSPVSVMPPSPSTDNVRPKVNLPGPPELRPSKKMVEAKQSGGPGGKIPDVNELAARFAQLKR